MVNLALTVIVTVLLKITLYLSIKDTKTNITIGLVCKNYNNINLIGEPQMSTIKITQLNQNTSELNTLNDRETAEVVGGYYYGSYSYSSYVSTNISEKLASVKQENVNFNSQAALGGGKFSSNGNSNSTSQGNSLSIDQRY